MPELPEVETVRRGLERSLIGKKIERVYVLREDSVETPSVTEFSRQLKGKVFRNIRRRGKYLLFDLAPAGLLVIHLRMSGRLLTMTAPRAVESGDGTRRGKNSKSSTRSIVPVTPYERIRFELGDNNLLIFDDMRVFGRAWFLPADDSESLITGIAGLGPEPLEDLAAHHLSSALSGKKQAIKTALLDQTIIAGIGNIYADEILHLSRVSPVRPAGNLTRAEIERITENIKLVLTQAIIAGGSTIRDYVNSEGVNGNYQSEAFVYGREGERCRHCSETIQRIKLGGRSSHFCPRCQPDKKTKRAVVK